MIEQWIGTINGYLWGSVLIYLLTGCGVWFTWRLKGLQITRFTHMFTLLKLSRKADSQGISSFQALCTSLAARVGTGNLMGVAVAITLGGAGAVFWMWLIALVGMATAFAESALGQLYKEKDANGNFRGGPAYYMSKGLKNYSKTAFDDNVKFWQAGKGVGGIRSIETCEEIIKEYKDPRIKILILGYQLPPR